MTKFKESARPVLEPSVFKDDGDGGWTVVRRRHRSPVITGKIQFSNNAKISKTTDLSALGLVKLWASPTKQPGVCSPSRVRSDGDFAPRQARVGNFTVGHAFRRLLGFSWRKKEPGEPVWRQHDLPSVMNGDGGRGGFNPGRGAFNAGRGGF
jgi:hypothetical protein